MEKLENIDWKVLLYVPNVIGYVRILLTLTSFVLLGLQLPGWFVVVYASAIILDGFDGYFARKLGQCSKYGAWLDVVIDNLGRSLLWAHMHPMASTVSALEWTVFVCNHQLGDDWHRRVSEGASRTEQPVAAGSATLGGQGINSKPCTTNGTKPLVEFQKDALTPAEGFWDKTNYKDIHKEEDVKCLKRSFAEDCKDDSSKEVSDHNQTIPIATEYAIPHSSYRSKETQDNILKSDNSPPLVQWIMKNNFRSVGGVWAIAGLHILPLWLLGLHHGVFATSLYFLPSQLPIIGVLVLGVGRLLCGVAEVWCVWLHIRALITATTDKNR